MHKFWGQNKDKGPGSGEEKGYISSRETKPSCRSKVQQSAINSLLTAGNRLSFIGRLNRFVD